MSIIFTTLSTAVPHYITNLNISSFKAFMASMFQVKVFWAVMPCSVVVGYQHFWVHAAAIFRVKMEAADLQNVIILPQHYRVHNPEDLYLKLKNIQYGAKLLDQVYFKPFCM
jgi:hypothetical protein